MPWEGDVPGLPHVPGLAPNGFCNDGVLNMGEFLTFMQYAACMHDEGVWHDACSHPDAPHVMGYALRTRRWRYVEWVRFDKHQAAPLWDQGPVGTELYDHTENDTVANVAESVNVVARPENAAVVARLSRMLRAGWRNASTEVL